MKKLCVFLILIATNSSIIAVIKPTLLIPQPSSIEQKEEIVRWQTQINKFEEENRNSDFSITYEHPNVQLATELCFYTYLHERQLNDKSLLALMMTTHRRCGKYSLAQYLHCPLAVYKRIHELLKVIW